ncbi:hypothetical protein NDR87_33315 [Nocardia sp. CDC159]|uniref:Tat pathway signal sequence domain protein n=1 Tax=Nocardia pulmonis TaxID=2951408 RepID=A0A9X2EDJ3_9NOCA|nr:MULTISPECIES: hypothetical protein [Nocardia]MCM6778340.1 hypothetical protein [Nocardia pulmonis]MCM6791264.1 hypothetical protein [Nocardia sp. CDC159]
MTVRRLWGVLAAASIGAALLVLPAAPVRAADGDLACSANLEFAFEPALKAGASAEMTVTGTLRDCTSLNGRHGDLSSATVKATAQATAIAAEDARCGLAISAAGTGTIGWVEGATSAIEMKIAPNSSSGMVLKATVTDGEPKGDEISLLSVGTQKNPKCGTKGLSTLAVQGVVRFD